MFAIISGGLKGFCDKPRYVKLKNDIYIECGKEDASHVAIGGVAYDLNETFVKPVDGGEIAFRDGVRLENAESDINDLDAMVVDMAYDNILNELEV